MTLRIISKDSRSGLGLESAEDNSDGYMERLIKLVPTEAVTAYPLLQAKIAPMQGAAAKYALFVLAWALLIVVVAVRYKTTSSEREGPQWSAIFIAVVSFIIWVYAQNGDFGVGELLLARLDILKALANEQTQAIKDFTVSLAFVLWTVLVPLFYKGGK